MAEPIPDLTADTAPVAAGQDSTPVLTDDTVHTVTHRWPWRLSEVASIAIVAIGCLLVGAAPLTLNAFLIGIACAIISIVWISHTKISRVKRSQVVINLRGQRVTTDSRGVLGMSAVTLTKVVSFSQKRYASDDTFMLSDGVGSARIPLRSTIDPLVRAAVALAHDSAEDITADGEALYQRMLAGDIPAGRSTVTTA